MKPVSLEISPAHVARLLAGIVCFLGLMHIAGKISTLAFDHSYWHGLIPLFDLDEEFNVPSIYSGLALAFSAILLALIGSAEAKLGRLGYLAFWALLALVFLFLAIDETFELHERLESPVRSALKTTGVLYYAWVIPYGTAAVLLGLFCLRFLMRLPREIRVPMLISGAVYVSGAVGLEMIGGALAEHLEKPELDPLWVLASTLEELLEMTGVVIFIHTLLSYLGLLGVRIEFKGGASSE
jgi:hypothetical protein